MAGAGRPSTSSFANAQTWMPVPTSGTTSELRHERQPLLHTRRPRSYRAPPGARQFPRRVAAACIVIGAPRYIAACPYRRADPDRGRGNHQLRPRPADRGRRAAAATPWPPAQHLQPAGPRRSARAHPPADPRLRAGGARCRNPDGAASPGALRAVRQPRRRGAEHPLGQHRRLGGALAGLDLPPGGAQRRALLRSAKPTPSEPGHIPAGARTNVPLPQPRLPGPLSPVAAWTR